MSAIEIRKHITATPFVPFDLHMSDGRKIRVHARDFIMISPIGTVLDIFQPDGDHDILATGGVTGLTFSYQPEAPIAPSTFPSDN